MNLRLIQDFSFLNALGVAILQSLWQCFLLWALYETIIVAAKNITSKVKHNLSELFVFASFGWFIFTFISKLFTAPNTYHDAGLTTSEFNGNLIHDSLNQFAAFSGNAIAFLSVAYLFLLFLFIIKLISAYSEVKLVAQKSLISAPVHLQNFTEKVANEIKIPKRIKVWVSENIDVPATIGFLKPVILIPLSSINNLTSYQLEAILLHEISHIKRNDYLVNLLISIIETVMFFNPFVALMIKSIKRERENCCDDFVLMYRYDAHSYASALLQLEKFRNSNVELSLSAVSNKKQLFSRVKRIMGTGTTLQSNYAYRLLALITITSILCLLNIALLSIEPKQNISSEAFNPKSDLLWRPSADMILLSTQGKQADEKNWNGIGKKEIPKAAIGNSNKKDLETYKDKSNSPINKSENHLALTDPRPDDELEIDQKIDYGTINDALQMAMKEIKNLDWGKIEKNINKSLEEVKKQNLFTNQSKLNKVLKNIPQIKINTEATEALKKFTHSKYQKVVFDSLKIVENMLLAQKATLFAAAQSERLQKLFEDPSFKKVLNLSAEIKDAINSNVNRQTLKL
ncbi:MAG: M56 family metallopeptidase [Ginsengibacter sp.]